MMDEVGLDRFEFCSFLLACFRFSLRVLLICLSCLSGRDYPGNGPLEHVMFIGDDRTMTKP